MNNFNIDENMINNLKKKLDNGELSDVISKIPPEFIQNFSSAVNNTDNLNNSNANTNNSHNLNDSNEFSSSSVSSQNAPNKFKNSNSNYNSSGNSGNFDFNNIDINTIMKIKSIMDKMNIKDDPRSNLLQSLKPYLRDERKAKVDQYANLINVAKIADLFKNDSTKENNNDVS